MSEVRKNPPSSVVVAAEHEMYKVLYDDLTREGKILQYGDRHALAELAVTLVECADLRKHVRTHGVMMEVEGDRGMVTKRNGSCDVLDRKITAVHRLMKAFGMAPEYRPKMVGGDVPAQSESDGFDKV